MVRHTAQRLSPPSVNKRRPAYFSTARPVVRKLQTTGQEVRVSDEQARDIRERDAVAERIAAVLRERSRTATERRLRDRWLQERAFQARTLSTANRPSPPPSLCLDLTSGKA